MGVMGSRVGRPAKTLLERVVERSFRPERYGHLLDSDPLPEEPPAVAGSPFGEEYRGLVWEALREWQDWYLLHAHREKQDTFDLDGMWEITREFSWLVHHLHGGRRPVWFAEWLEDRGHKLPDLP